MINVSNQLIKIGNDRNFRDKITNDVIVVYYDYVRLMVNREVVALWFMDNVWEVGYDKVKVFIFLDIDKGYNLLIHVLKHFMDNSSFSY